MTFSNCRCLGHLLSVLVAFLLPASFLHPICSPLFLPDLTKLPLGFLSYSNPIVLHLRSLQIRNVFLFLLLLLAGDVERKPGPCVVSSNLNFVHLNTRSASSVSDSYDKPALLK